MKNLLIIKFDSFAVSIVSIIQGLNLIIFPDLVDYGKTYEVLSNILNSSMFGIIFIILAILKMIGIFANLPKLRAISISALVGVWTLFTICICLTGVSNSVWPLSLAMVIFSSGIVIKEWFH